MAQEQQVRRVLNHKSVYGAIERLLNSNDRNAVSEIRHTLSLIDKFLDTQDPAEAEELANEINSTQIGLDASLPAKFISNRKYGEVLQRILDRIDSSKKQMVIFDIDSTLMNTSPRNYRILVEAAGIYPELTPYVSRLTESDLGWNIMDDLKSVGFENGRVIQKLTEFWARRFFTNKYVLYDTPYEGSVDFVRELYNRGIFVYYLTGRDVPGMYDGTFDSLRICGFPIGDKTSTTLHCKPCFEIADIDFKKEAIREIKSMGMEVLASFENEPGNANAFKESFPDADSILIKTITSPNPPELREDVIELDSYV